MITRGHIIGKIIDDIAMLNSEIEFRNRAKIFDLTKFVEDFMKSLLNITYSLSLKNLNSDRSNNPGLDLGDRKKALAYQVTTEKGSKKINETLAAITADQKSEFATIKIFVVGTKQGAYTVNSKLMENYKFSVKENIVDFHDLMRDILSLEIDQLDAIFQLFKREFRAVKLELEVPDGQGAYETSLYNALEKKPSSPPTNADRFFNDWMVYSAEQDSADLFDIYKRLAATPRISRELLAIIADRGTKSEDWKTGSNYKILPGLLARILKMNDSDLTGELTILEEKDLITTDEDEVNGRPVRMISIRGPVLNALIHWLQGEHIDLRIFFSGMDFTILDKN